MCMSVMHVCVRVGTLVAYRLLPATDSGVLGRQVEEGVAQP